MQRQMLYLGEINDSQEASWRKTMEVFDEQKKRHEQLSLFPSERPFRCTAKLGPHNLKPLCSFCYRRERVTVGACARMMGTACRAIALMVPEQCRGSAGRSSGPRVRRTAHHIQRFGQSRGHNWGTSGSRLPS